MKYIYVFTVGVLPFLGLSTYASALPEAMEMEDAVVDNAAVAELAQAAPVNVQALIEACRNTQPAVVRLLLRAKADVTSGEALMVALRSIEKGAWSAHRIDACKEIVKMLLKAPVQLDAQMGRYKTTVWASASLSSAVRVGFSYEEIALFYNDVIKMILAAGATIDVPDIYGETELMGALKESHFERVRLLVLGGASLNLKDDEGRTALSHTGMLGQQTIHEALKEKALWKQEYVYGYRLSAIKSYTLLLQDICCLVRDYENEYDFLDERVHTLALKRHALSNLVSSCLQKVNALVDIVLDYDSQNMAKLFANPEDMSAVESVQAGSPLARVCSLM